MLFFGPQIVEDLVEMDHCTSQERISERIYEQSVDVPTLERLKQFVNAPFPQVVGEIVGVAVSHNVKEMVQPVRHGACCAFLSFCHRRDHSKRHVEQSVNEPVPEGLKQMAFKMMLTSQGSTVIFDTWPEST